MTWRFSQSEVSRAAAFYSSNVTGKVFSRGFIGLKFLDRRERDFDLSFADRGLVKLSLLSSSKTQDLSPLVKMNVQCITCSGTG